MANNQTNVRQNTNQLDLSGIGDKIRMQYKAILRFSVKITKVIFQL